MTVDFTPSNDLYTQPYTLLGDHLSTGTEVRVGPVSALEGIRLIDELFTPNGWTPRFERRLHSNVLPMDRATAIITAGTGSEPAVEGTDLFIILRAKIIQDRDNDSADPYCRRTASMLVHIEPHRPQTLWTGDEECQLGECALDPDHTTCNIEPTGRWCVACSIIYDTNSEYGPEWIDACQVEWPCAPLRKVAAFYGVALDAWLPTTPAEPTAVGGAASG